MWKLDISPKENPFPFRGKDRMGVGLRTGIIQLDIATIGYNLLSIPKFLPTCVGVTLPGVSPTPIPAFPLKGKEFL